MPTAATPWYSKLGAALEGMFPNIDAVRASTGAAINTNVNAGDYARAAGNVINAAIKYPIAAVDDVAQPVTSAIRGVVGAAPAFLSGILGSTGDVSVPAVKPVVATSPVADAMAQGRAAGAAAAAAAPPTPQERLGGALAAVLGRNPSIAEVQALGGLPAITQLAAASTKPLQSAKDQAFGMSTALAHDTFASEIAAANQMTDQAKAKAAAAKATDKYQRSLLEAISPRGAQAEMLQPQDQ